MDSLRGQADLDGEDIDDFGAIEAPPMFQSEERRMHVRAYNYWVSLLGNRALPSIEDLNPEETEDFSANSVLLDFSMGLENPAILYLGSALREECGVTGPIERVDDVPPRSLLTRLTDHYLQIIANAAPVGFEAEFVNQRGIAILYRGILMPFSSDDETIDFIYGVINWREAVSDSVNEQLGAEMHAALGVPVPRSETPIWAEGPSVTSDFIDEEDSLDDGDFGFDEEPVAVAEVTAEPLSSVPAPLDESIAAVEPLDLAGFASETDTTDIGLDDSALDDPLGSLDDLLSLPEEDAQSSASAETETQSLDELDLGAFLMPEEPVAEASISEQAPDAAVADFDIDLDDLLADLEPEAPVLTAAEVEAQPEGRVTELVADPSDQPLEDLPDVDDILAGIDLHDDTAVAIDAQEPEVSSDLDLDDLLGDIGLDDEPVELEDTVTSGYSDFAPAPAFAELADEVEDLPPVEMPASEGHGEDADLADLLAEARSSAAEVLDCDARSRAALYRAIGNAHDFALSAQGSPTDYAEMLEDAGIVPQERSPMTAVIKLVFGADYDKTRIAEYALALDYANSTGMSRGELAELLSVYKGGLKGLVQQMRAARKGETDTPASRSLRRLDRAVRKLNRAKVADASALPFGELGLAVVIARREEDGSINLVAGVSLEDKAAQKVMIAASKSLGRK